MEMMTNIGKLYKFIILMRAFISVTGYNLIWPVIQTYGFTGDLKGILLFAIPIYTFVFVSSNQDLAKLSLMSILVTFSLHILIFCVRLNYSVQSSVLVWILIGIVNLISIFWSIKEPVKKIESLQKDFDSFVKFLKR